MKGRLFLFLLISTLLFNCSDNIFDQPNIFYAKPVVKKTEINYTKDSFINSFPNNSSLQFISNAYTNNFTKEIRNDLLEYMKEEVSKLGEEVIIFENILNKTHCYDKDGYVLPTYAERAKYENKDVWILQITHGLGKPVFGRFKCFVFGIPDLDTLNYVGSR